MDKAILEHPCHQHWLHRKTDCWDLFTKTRTRLTCPEGI